MWRHLSLACACALAGCDSALPPPGPGNADGVQSIRLFDGAGVDRTNHIVLFRSDTLHLEVRIYADDGHNLIEVRGGVDVTFTFDPTSLAVSTPVPGAPLEWAVTTTALVGTLGNLRVTLRFLADGSERSFGPFQCLVH